MVVEPGGSRPLADCLLHSNARTAPAGTDRRAITSVRATLALAEGLFRFRVSPDPIRSAEQHDKPPPIRSTPHLGGRQFGTTRVQGQDDLDLDLIGGRFCVPKGGDAREGET